jgi:DHA1 family bicyclomycin/chloramphenicol resistance-like MFS transporter
MQGDGIKIVTWTPHALPDMAAPSIRTILPLSIVTCTSMLAMDLYLPAVPGLQRALGIQVTLAQATVAVFLAGLALSQLMWAEAMSRLGPRRAIGAAVMILALAAAACAVAPNIEVLLAMRLLQGVAAGAATVVAPSVVRATLSDADSVRGIAAISTVESVVPAAGPVLGAALLTQMSWRGLFWVLAALTLLVLPFVLRVTPSELPGLDRSVDASYLRILASRRYLRLALSHALSVGALLAFVASAPQLLVNALKLGTEAFALLQVLGVAAFMLLATQSGRVSQRIGPARAVQWGAAFQLGVCAVLMAATVASALSFMLVAAFWCGFCGALAIRGPSAFSQALAVPPAQMGRASAMLVLAILLAGALGTQLVAPFMEGSGAALAAAMLIISAISCALVIPYPAVPPKAPASTAHDA